MNTSLSHCLHQNIFFESSFYTMPFTTITCMPTPPPPPKKKQQQKHTCLHKDNMHGHKWKLIKLWRRLHRKLHICQCWRVYQIGNWLIFITNIQIRLLIGFKSNVRNCPVINDLWHKRHKFWWMAVARSNYNLGRRICLASVWWKSLRSLTTCAHMHANMHAYTHVHHHI